MAGPFRLNPFPDGRLFAVSFVDDTDLSTRGNTEPVYEFLREHRFFGTKTVWPLAARRTSSFRSGDERLPAGSSPGQTLEDPSYRDFVVELKNAGFEIGLHGVSAGNSTRAEIEAGLERFREVFGEPPAINAFHQANVENLYAGSWKLDSPFLRLLERMTHRSDYQGHVEGSPYFWGDIARATFRYVRLPFHTIADVNTLRVCPQMPFRDPRRPYVRQWFACSDGADVGRFVRLLGARNLARLEQERGACLIYTHFAKGFVEVRDGVATLSPRFVDVVQRIAGRPGAWLPTASTLLDRLSAVRRIALEQNGSRLSLHNMGDEGVTGVSLIGPPSAELGDEAAGQLPHTSSGDWLLPPIPPGGSIHLRTNAPAVWSVPCRPDEITTAQHRRIEYRNYAGLLRSAVLDHLQRRRIRTRTGETGRAL